MRNTLLRNNRKSARSRWGSEIDASLLQTLKAHTERFKLSISNGDLLLLDRRWYVTHTGLVGLANRRHCHGIDVQPSVEFSHPNSSRWAFKATVFKSSRCKGFVGYGDADPSNVSPLVHGAEMRVAETRAVNRALRKAYGIGICSVEEIGSFAEPAPSPRESKKIPPQPVNGKNGNYGGPKVRDRLCQLIRQHRLDANWSSPTPSISAAPSPSAKPPASRCKLSLAEILQNSDTSVADVEMGQKYPARKSYEKCPREKTAHPYCRG